MSKKFDSEFEEVLYAMLIDYAAKTLNSEEIAPIFKSKTAAERRAIKEAILRRLQEKVKKVGKQLSEKKLSDPQILVMHKQEVRNIISDIFRDRS
jgi:uncharacterized protein YaaR (DUF327 family)